SFRPRPSPRSHAPSSRGHGHCSLYRAHSHRRVEPEWRPTRGGWHGNCYLHWRAGTCPERVRTEAGRVWHAPAAGTIETGNDVTRYTFQKEEWTMFMARVRGVLKNPKGFTLIEIAIVVAIIGLLLMIALPLYSGARVRAYVAEARSLGSEWKCRQRGDEAV